MKRGRSAFVFLVAGIAGALLAAVQAKGISRTPDGPFLYRHPIFARDARAMDAELERVEARVRRDPDGGLERAHLAALYLDRARRGRDPSVYAAAEEQARLSLESLPFHNAGAHAVIGQAALARHDFEEAIRRADAALAMSPDSLEALTIRVTALLPLKRTAEASADADRAVKTRPVLAAFALRGLVREAEGRLDDAVTEWMRALAVEDFGDVRGSSWVRSLLGRAHIARGDLRLARNFLDEALRVSPGDPMAIGLLARLEERSGNRGRADALYMSAFNVSGDAVFLVDRGAMRANAGDAHGAKECWDVAEALLRDEVRRPGGRQALLDRLMALRAPAG